MRKNKDFGIRLQDAIYSNKDAGQAVYHIHLHMLGGRRLAWPPGCKFTKNLLTYNDVSVTEYHVYKELREQVYITFYYLNACDWQRGGEKVNVRL